MTKRIPPTPEDVAILQRRIGRLMNEAADQQLAGKIDQSQFYRAMKNACGDYLEYPR